MIASRQPAITEGHNQLKTGTLTQKAIENRADYNASSVGLGLGFSQSLNQPAAQNGVGKNQLGQATAGALQVPGSQLPNQHGLSTTIPIVMKAGDSVSSTTGCGSVAPPKRSSSATQRPNRP
ncbi:MAG: hypothetical protein AB2993_01160 [Candidatus Symbiodolus clandestinus]